MKDRLLRFAQVEEMTTLRRHRIERLISEGRFPAPINVEGGPRGGCRFWLSEVEDWLKSRPRNNFSDLLNT